MFSPKIVTILTFASANILTTIIWCLKRRTLFNFVLSLCYRYVQSNDSLIDVRNQFGT